MRKPFKSDLFAGQLSLSHWRTSPWRSTSPAQTTGPWAVPRLRLSVFKALFHPAELDVSVSDELSSQRWLRSFSQSLLLSVVGLGQPQSRFHHEIPSSYPWRSEIEEKQLTCTQPSLPFGSFWPRGPPAQPLGDSAPRSFQSIEKD